MTGPKIALLCATRRGRQFLDTLVRLVSDCKLTVFSFREEPWEPPFFDEIKQTTESLNHRFVEARDVGENTHRHLWSNEEWDLLLAVSWRYMVPESVFRLPKRGAFVFHDSLLPRYRGFSPTVWAMINGEDHTGVSLFQMEKGVDSGPLVTQRRIEIDTNDTIATVMNRVTHAYLDILSTTLVALLNGNVSLKPQDDSQATYCCKRIPADNRIKWSEAAEHINNLVRAVTFPYSGAFAQFQGKCLRVWSAAIHHSARGYRGIIPGRVIDVHAGVGAVVSAKDTAILLKDVQLDGEGIKNAAEVITHAGLMLE